jgi:hypothetical protein
MVNATIPPDITSKPHSRRDTPANFDKDLISIGEYLSSLHWVELFGIIAWTDLLVNRFVLG